jgi:hypothetical protein
MIGASLAGIVIGESAAVWEISCVEPGGAPTTCSDPFVVCL